MGNVLCFQHTDEISEECSRDSNIESGEIAACSDKYLTFRIDLNMVDTYIYQHARAQQL